MKTPHRVVMVGGVQLGPGVVFEAFGAEAEVDSAQIVTLDGGAVIQARYSDPVRPVSVAPSGLTGRFTAGSLADYRQLLGLLSRGAPLPVFLGDYIAESWLVSSDITERRTTRRLPTGIPGLVAAEWISATIDGVAAEIITAGPGPGQVQIPTTTATFGYSTIITEDLLAAGASWLTLVYAPYRLCTVRHSRATEGYNNYSIEISLQEAVA